ncbi:DUF898 family protein [Sulfitobacter sp. S190]|nr:DUF898 family protein [Sulfitobacter sp. S190]
MPVWFGGARSALFWLAVKTGFLSIVTLGFYRFWMKTRLRRWFWSAIRPGGHPMEYVGDPLEKLLGFFIAVVILTFYIGLVNLVLMFVSFSVFNNSVFGYVASFAGVVPLWFYAQYRARRYVLARTRWRGVRFGLEPGAWGYALRALMHWAITLCTLGLLWPRMTFYLEKYKTDRTYFGSARLAQGGRWTMLYRAAIPMLVAVGCGALLTLWVLVLTPVFPGGPLGALEQVGDALENPFGAQPEIETTAPSRLLLFIPLFFLLGYGAVHYRFAAKRILANHKTANGVALVSQLSALQVSVIYVLGTLIAYTLLVMGIAGLLALAFGLWGVGDLVSVENSVLEGLPLLLRTLVFALSYLGVFLLWSALYNAFVTFPLMRHMAATLSLSGTAGLQGISQRARDEFAEAEGFAEALDLGAAI